MNSEIEKKLEAAIERELKALPQLAAPDSLARRVMSAVNQCPEAPWYRRSWQTWPAGLRAVSLLVMLVLFSGLCLAGWKLSHADSMVRALHRMGEFGSGLAVIGDVLAILLNSMVLVLKNLGTGFLVTCLFSVCLAYAMCVGLGTVYVRLVTGRMQTREFNL